MLIELSVNDYGYLCGEAAQPVEQLTRRVMSLSSEPLVVYVTLVDLIEKVKWWKSVLNPRCFNLEDIGQHEIARYYNITVFSWRDIVCPMDTRKSKRRIEIKPSMINADHSHWCQESRTNCIDADSLFSERTKTSDLSSMEECNEDSRVFRQNTASICSIF